MNTARCTGACYLNWTVLWVIKADDRALTVDEQFWHGVMQPYRQKVLFVINRADKIEPCHEWDT